MNTLFDTYGKLSAEARDCWRAMTQREFYSGELEPGSAGLPSFRLQKTVGYPVSLTLLQCNAPIGYRRSWEHIRQDPAALRVLWFVRRGAMSFTRSTDEFRIVGGQCGLLDCNVPFVGRIETDGASTFESIQALVPAQVFLDCIPNGSRCTGSFELAGAAGEVVESSLDLLWRHGESLEESTRAALLRLMLGALGECIGEHPLTHRLPTIAEKRTETIEEYILMHLSDPNLSADRVAAGCGISLRYLAHLMRERNSTFTEFLWKNRLPLARDNLLSSGLRDRPISEVAYMSGFKSAAHFCRMFKATYGSTPTEYRRANGAVAANGDCAEAGECNLHRGHGARRREWEPELPAGYPS